MTGKISRYFIWSTLFFAVPVLAGCDAIYGLLQKEGAEEKEIVGEIRPFERNEKVAEAQKLLKLYGYSVGQPDGVMGVNTRNAIEQFQTDSGIKASRFLDKETWRKLHRFDDYGLVYNGEINIRVVQMDLQALGFYNGKVDGKQGPKTDEAIREFQKSKGLNPDGRIGFKTLQALVNSFSYGKT